MDINTESPARRLRRGLPARLVLATRVRALLDAVLDVFVGDPTIVALDRLTDRQLADIGLTRLDVTEAASASRADRAHILGRATALRRRIRVEGG